MSTNWSANLTIYGGTPKLLAINGGLGVGQLSPDAMHGSGAATPTWHVARLRLVKPFPAIGSGPEKWIGPFGDEDTIGCPSFMDPGTRFTIWRLRISFWSLHGMLPEEDFLMISWCLELFQHVHRFWRGCFNYYESLSAILVRGYAVIHVFAFKTPALWYVLIGGNDTSI